MLPGMPSGTYVRTASRELAVLDDRKEPQGPAGSCSRRAPTSASSRRARCSSSAGSPAPPASPRTTGTSRRARLKRPRGSRCEPTPATQRTRRGRAIWRRPPRPRDVGRGAGPADSVRCARCGGGEGARTPDLGIANAALSQLSYAPHGHGHGLGGAGRGRLPPRRSSIGTPTLGQPMRARTQERCRAASRRRRACPPRSPGLSSRARRRSAQAAGRSASARLAGRPRQRRRGSPARARRAAPGRRTM